MKVMSYNVRGLGGVEKRSEVCRLVREKVPFVLCIQESKLAMVDDILVTSLWGNSERAFSFQPSIGASGGLLSVWDTTVVDVWLTMSFIHVLMIKGRVILTGQEFVIVNVYAPCVTPRFPNIKIS